MRHASGWTSAVWVILALLRRGSPSQRQRYEPDAIQRTAAQVDKYLTKTNPVGFNPILLLAFAFFANTGVSASVIRPFAGLRKPQIYLLDPYDPNKIPLLMVHGLQSTPEAAVFYRGGRFSGVRTLSPKSPALIALSELSIEVPYHSVIGQHNSGPKERGSDGVVPYWSSHLDGAQSEVIVRSGHGVFTNLDAVLETIWILHLEECSSKPCTRRSSASHRPIFSAASPSQIHSRQPSRLPLILWICPSFSR
jgi:hypothetical protein